MRCYPPVRRSDWTNDDDIEAGDHALAFQIDCSPTAESCAFESGLQAQVSALRANTYRCQPIRRSSHRARRVDASLSPCGYIRRLRNLISVETGANSPKSSASSLRVETCD